jgi:hypothetical protein
MSVQIFAKGCKINPNSKDMKFFLVQSRVQAMNHPIPVALAPLYLTCVSGMQSVIFFLLFQTARAMGNAAFQEKSFAEAATHYR